MTDRNAYLIIDAGGTFLKSAIMDAGGGVYEDSSFTTESHSEGSQNEILGALEKTIVEGLTFIRNNGLDLQAIGVCIPGPFDYKNGTSLMEHKYKGIKDLNLRKYFFDKPWFPSDIKFIFRHDVNSLVAGEIWRGNAQNYKNAAVLTLGTGLGFSFSVNKVVQSNEIGGPLISLFKYPYKGGILEDYISKRGILRLYNEISGSDVDIEISEIGNMARRGDKDALQTFEEAGKIIAENIGGILRDNNIECLLFGGQISRSFMFMEQALNKGLKDIGSLKKISIVNSIDYSALLGVLYTILHEPEFIKIQKTIN